MHRKPVFVAGCLAIVSAVMGCDKTPKIKTVPVTGTVTYKGQPVVGANVGFMSSVEAGRSAAGVTDSAGKFVLKTLVAGEKFAEGAMLGDYKVTVAKPVDGAPAGRRQPAGMDVATMSDEEKKKFADQFNAASKPTQNAPTEQSTAAESPKSELPKKYSELSSTDLAATVKADGKNEFPFELKDE